MPAPDPFEKHYERQQDKKRQIRALTSEDDPPLPDAPVEQAKAPTQPARNDPCPCGSGKKYKKCCGSKA